MCLGVIQRRVGRKLSVELGGKWKTYSYMLIEKGFLSEGREVTKVANWEVVMWEGGFLAECGNLYLFSGAKRLRALSTLVVAMILLPWALVQLTTQNVSYTIDSSERMQLV